MFALPFESLFDERSLQTAFERIHSIEEQAYLLARHIKGEDRYNAFIGKY